MNPEASPPALPGGPTAKHAQLSRRLVELVTRDLSPDAAIPSERDLMAMFGVSRATVRKAIDNLVTDGLLRRVHGRGTFVSRPRVESHLHLASFSEDMRQRGLTPSTGLLGVETVRPPSEVASALGLNRDARTWQIDRVRLADGSPIALEQGWFPEALLPGLDRQDLSGSLYGIFESTYGLPIDSADQTLWGESAEGAVARRLDVPDHTPLLVFRRIARSGDQPLEYVVSRYRGDRYQVHMSLGRDGRPGSPIPGRTNP